MRRRNSAVKDSQEMPLRSRNLNTRKDRKRCSFCSLADIITPRSRVVVSYGYDVETLFNGDTHYICWGGALPFLGYVRGRGCMNVQISLKPMGTARQA